MNNSIIILKIESIVKKLTKNNILGIDGITGDFYYKFKERIIPFLLKTILANKNIETFPNTLYENT